MSKVTKKAEFAMNSEWKDRKDVVEVAENIITGKRTITKDQATKMFSDASDILDVQFNRLTHNMNAMIELEITVVKRAEGCISSSKNLALSLIHI